MGVKPKKPAINEIKLYEKCGLVALYAPDLSPHQRLLTAINAGFGVQHRGQLGFGITYLTNGKLYRYTKNGHLRVGLTPNVINNLPIPDNNSYILLHCRYATDGSDDPRNLQPCLETSEDGTQWAVIHNGQFTAIPAMKEKVEKLYDEIMPEGVSDTYLFTKMLAKAEGKTNDERILKTVAEVNGAISAIIAADDALFVFRDQFGIRPLILGELGGGWIVTSETTALKQIETTPVREVKKSEVIRINPEGLTVLKKGTYVKGAFCSFEWDYFARPDSYAPTHREPTDGDNPKSWVQIAEARKRVGMYTAEELPVPDVDFVVGIPDSGIPFASGYAQGAQLPYNAIAIEKTHMENIPRTFQTDNKMDTIRDRIKSKYLFITNELEGKRVILCDDSLVRGHTSSVITQILRVEHHVKEIHWVFGFPKVLFPCHLGISMRTTKELIANQANEDVKRIAEMIGADSVTYTTPFAFLAGMKGKENIMNPEDPKEIFLANGFCGGCMTGVYPIDRDGAIYQLKSKMKPSTTSTQPTFPKNTL